MVEVEQGKFVGWPANSNARLAGKAAMKAVATAKLGDNARLPGKAGTKAVATAKLGDIFPSCELTRGVRERGATATRRTEAARRTDEQRQ